MPTSCSAFGCKNRYKPGEKVQYFRFPLKNKALLDAWVIAVRRVDFKPTTYTRICSVHFEESDYLVRPGTYVKHLKPDAVPSVFPAFPQHLQKKKNERISIRQSEVLNNVQMEVDSKADLNISEQVVDEKPVLEDNSTESGLICKLDQSTQTDANYNSDLKKEIKMLQQKVRRRDENINNLKELLSVLRGKSLIERDTEQLDSFPMTQKNVEVKDETIFGETKKSVNLDDHETSIPSIPLFKHGLLKNNKCCVPNCEDISSPRHRFPENDPCRSLMWINKISSKLLDLSMNEILKSYVVCHTHFKKEFKVGRNHLTLNAIPTLYLPDTVPVEESDVKTEDFCVLESEKEIQKEVDFKIPLDKTVLESVEESEMEYIVITDMDDQLPDFDINVEMMEFIATAAKYLKPLNKESNFNIQVNQDELAVSSSSSQSGNKEQEILNNSKKYLDYLRPYECKICDFKTLHSRHLTVHLRTHKEKVEYACSICSRKFFVKAGLRKHFQRIHSEKRLISCQLCDYKTALTRNLTKHLAEAHNKWNMFKCNFCDYTTKRKYSLKYHLRSHTGEKPYMCEVCGKKFTTTFSLREHSRTHTGEKPFLCEYCHYRTTHRIILKWHLRTHTGEKPYMCNVCGYRATQNIQLKNHMRRHTGEKPFMCEVCGYRASRKKQLTAHFKSHTEVRDFACHLCDYKCKFRNRLKEHIRTHTGEKPFECTICDFSSAIKANLQTHLLLHSKTNLVCEICDYKTLHKGYFENHMKKHKT